jgi:transcriptional regulator with XRE-family HTH domain
MPTQKLYAGAKLREVRTRIGLTQKDFAAKLGVSLPYLNQMENNNRPVSTSVVLGLAREFGLDVTELGSGDTERLVSDMREAIADPVFADTAPPLSDLRLAASNAPALARAFLDLHRAYRQTHERLASLDEALGQDGSATQSHGRRCAISSTTATITSTPSTAPPNVSQARRGRSRRPYRSRGFRRSGITLKTAAAPGVRHYDRATRTLTLSPRARPRPSASSFCTNTRFWVRTSFWRPRSTSPASRPTTAREIARIGMANYFAGAS